MLEFGCMRNVVSYNSMLNCLYREGKFDDATKIWHRTLLNGSKPDAFTYNTLVHGL